MSQGALVVPGGGAAGGGDAGPEHALTAEHVLPPPESMLLPEVIVQHQQQMPKIPAREISFQDFFLLTTNTSRLEAIARNPRPGRFAEQRRRSHPTAARLSRRPRRTFPAMNCCCHRRCPG